MANSNGMNNVSVGASNSLNLEKYFQLSFQEAKKGITQKHGGPFGAVIIHKGKIIASAHNTVLKDNDPTCHAEVNAIRKACKKLKQPHLEDSILIASSEPCPMCLTTSYWAQIKQIYFAVPQSVAAKVGFSDSFIYQDLKKVPSKREVHVYWTPQYQKDGEKIFTEWRQKNGKLY